MKKNEKIIFINEYAKKAIKRKIIFQSPDRKYSDYESAYLVYISYVLTHLDNIAFAQIPIELIAARKMFDELTIPFLKSTINKDNLSKDIFETCFMLYDRLENEKAGLKAIDRELGHIVVPTLEEMGTLERMSVRYRVLKNNE